MKEPMNPRYLRFRHLKIVIEMCFMQALSSIVSMYMVVCEKQTWGHLQRVRRGVRARV